MGEALPAHLVEFERLLADEGTTIVKFFLHISKEEQRRRLQARIDDPTKHWKFAMGDLDERKLWDDYQTRLRRCHLQHVDRFAPVVRRARPTASGTGIWSWPSVLVEILEKMELRYPAPEERPDRRGGGVGTVGSGSRW